MEKETFNPVVVAAEVSAATCTSCSAWSPYPNEQQKGRALLAGRCHLEAPKTHVVLVPVRTVQGDGMSATVITAWPETVESDYCMSHFTGEDEAETDSDSTH